MPQPLIDPASGRPYMIDESGRSIWLDQPYPGLHADTRTPDKAGARRWLIPTGTAILGLILGSASASGGNGTTTSTASSAQATATVTVTARGAASGAAPKAETVTVTAAPKAAAAPAGIPGDGTYLVGTDIKAGTYRSGKPASGNCYWARLKGESGSFGDIISNSNSAGQSVVTIKASDKVFQTNGCEDWIRVR